MKLVLVLGALLAGVLSDEDFRAAYRAACEKYETPNNLGLRSSYPRHDQAHYKEFVKFAQSVKKHNEDPNGYEAEVNMFALMMRSERYQWTGLNATTVLEAQKRSLSSRSGVIVPVVERQAADSVDYSKKLPPVKNQGRCGSCWAFGAIVALEYQVSRTSQKAPKSLSDQQYLDCVYEGSRDGCKGGWPASCYSWTQRNGNAHALAKDYPYKGVDGTCDKSKPNGIRGYSVNGARYLSRGDANMLAAVQNPAIGVISVAFGVVDDFFSYKTGIYSPANAASCMRINHALDVVGYGPGFWNVRNSWGSGWGDKGYVKIARSATQQNVCAISNHGHYPLVTGSDPEDDEDDSDDDDNSDGDDDEEEEEEEKVCKWVEKAGMKMRKKLKGPKVEMEAAKLACIANKECKAITCKNKNNCWQNGKPRGKSDERFNGWVKKC